MAPRITDSKIRFWNKVDKRKKCWLWKGVVQGRGYGFFVPDATVVGRKKYGGILAHRFSYFIEHGYVGNKLVCHKFVNNLCVRPSHLFIGTPKMNTADMIKKCR